MNRTLSSVGGTVAATHKVCTSPSAAAAQEPFQILAGHVAGGTHHAFRDRCVSTGVLSWICTKSAVFRCYGCGCQHFIERAHVSLPLTCDVCDSVSGHNVCVISALCLA